MYPTWTSTQYAKPQKIQLFSYDPSTKGDKTSKCVIWTNAVLLESSAYLILGCRSRTFDRIDKSYEELNKKQQLREHTSATHTGHL